MANKKPAGDSQQGDDEKTSNQFEAEHIIHKPSKDDGNSRNSSEDQEECTETQTQPQQQQQTQQQNYQLAKDKKKRQTRPPQRYGTADLIAYALATSHEI